MNHVLLSVVGVTAIGAAQAFGTITYGNFAGATVDFLGVAEASGTDPEPLFGSPTVAGNSLNFSPTTFVSSSSNGSNDITDGTLTFRIMARPGNFIPTINFAESGDFTLFGLSGTAATNATVQAAVFITVEEVNGVALSSVVNVSGNLAMTVGAGGPGNFQLQSNAGVGQIWTGFGSFDINAALALAGISGQATKVLVSLDNTLTTQSEAGTISFIKKKDVGGTAITVVPTPGSIAVLGLAGLIAGRRRRN